MSSSKNINIAVIFPSRGLAFSETCEELLNNLEGYKYDIFFSHGLPIPTCFNKPLKSALNGSYSHIWFVEDDMILPKNCLRDLLKENVDAVTANYPLSRDGMSSIFADPEGNAIYCGTGCLLVTMDFIKKFKFPVFKTDTCWDIKVKEDHITVKSKKSEVGQYGLHDINFSLEAYRRKMPIKISEVKCGQRKLIALGQTGTNNGEHIIARWNGVKIPLTVKETKETNRNVILEDGTETFMDINRARELEKKGKVKIPELTYVRFEK